MLVGCCKLLVVVTVVIIAIVANVTLKTIVFNPDDFPDKISDIDTTNITYVTIPTYSLNLQAIQIGKNATDRPLLIFLHGFPETALLSWHKQLTHFAALDKYFIIAPDMRGYNKSDKPKNMMDYHLSHLVSDVHAIIKQYAGREDAYIVAHDWGAIVAWKFAQTFPEMTKKLVVLNVPHPGAVSWLVEEKKWEVVQAQALKSWYIFFFQLPFPLPELRFYRNDFSTLRAVHIPLGRKKIISTKILDRYIQAYNEPGGLTAMMNYYRAFITGKLIMAVKRLFVRDYFAEKYYASDDKLAIKSPTMIIWGKDDIAIEFEAARVSWERGVSEEGKKHGKFVPLEGVSHFVPNDSSDKVNELLEEFLN